MSRKPFLSLVKLPFTVKATTPEEFKEATCKAFAGPATNDDDDTDDST